MAKRHYWVLTTCAFLFILHVSHMILCPYKITDCSSFKITFRANQPLVCPHPPPLSSLLILLSDIWQPVP